MKVKCGRYTIYSDAYCMWIAETRESKDKDGKPTGKTREERVAGYCENLEQLMEDFIEKRTRNSDATTLKQLLKDLASAERDAKKILKEVKKDGRDRVRKG